MNRDLQTPLAALVCAAACLSWGNGPPGNAQTDDPSECPSPTYSTHDWVADHALALLPDEEKAWILPHNRLYLLGTEAPDNRNIPEECGQPGTGYDDRWAGHSMEWDADWEEVLEDRAAARAQEEYGKAVVAFLDGEPAQAAYYLGAMAHYIGDTSQYGHCIDDEEHHADYETWAKSRTEKFDDDVFEDYIEADSLVRRTAYTAAKRSCLAVGKGIASRKILSAAAMDAHYSNKDQEYLDSVGGALNYGINELADVLHTFWLNVVEEE